MSSDDTRQIVRKLELNDLAYLEEHLLPINKIEIKAMRDQTVRELFETNPDMLESSDVLVIDDKIICVGGGRETEEGFVIWLFGTVHVPDHKKAFAIITSRRVAFWKEQNNVVYSYVYSENTLTKEWLINLGFTIFNAEPVGVNDELFHYFEWRKECA